MYYTFKQNNSGGSFTINNELTTNVIIEADSHYEANAKLESLGGYFNGCDDGLDCSCCGDRWYNVDADDGTVEPQIYSSSVQEYLTSDYFFPWAPKGKEVVVYHKSGLVEWF